MDCETLNKAFSFCASFVVCKVCVCACVCEEDGGRKQEEKFLLLEKFHYFAQNSIWDVVAHTANRCCYNRHLKEGLSRGGALHHSWRPF